MLTYVADLAPKDGDGHVQGSDVQRLWDRSGIPFDEWLNIFLEYALGLARSGKSQEAYVVLSAARDSVVYKSKESAFLIHLAWAGEFLQHVAP
jgi:general transcription factor 3C polypeptide 3 (transcription factor C subunit 4)